ncbi:MAG: hypothetical protein ACXWYJ_08105 [Actinomycetota bacterium]
MATARHSIRARSWHAGFVRGEVYVRRFADGIEKEFLRMTRPA